MENQEHLDILKQGVEVWNAWRKQHPTIRPDLSLTELIRADLSRADLNRANLIGADLSDAKLIGADLSDAELIEANLNRADLCGADLSRADLSDAKFGRANLSRADLSGANLIGADFSSAVLNGTAVGWTQFDDVDLGSVKGLETIEHRGPSSIGIDTLYRSGGDIPEAFLKGAGLDDSFITYIRSRITNSIKYYTCFISYSSKDKAFAKRLYDDLQNNNVRCWFAPEDLKIGDEFTSRIDELIMHHDKLIVILSQHSINSSWVEFEVNKALKKEQEQAKLVLFPLKLDESVMETPEAWAAAIRKQRHIGDFTQWKNHDAYQKAFTQLLRDLKAES